MTQRPHLRLKNRGRWPPTITFQGRKYVISMIRHTKTAAFEKVRTHPKGWSAIVVASDNRLESPHDRMPIRKGSTRYAVYARETGAPAREITKQKHW